MASSEFNSAEDSSPDSTDSPAQLAHGAGTDSDAAGAQEPASTLRQDAVRGAAWMGLERWTTQSAALGVFIVLGRILSPRDFGLAAAASTIIWFLRVVADQGLNQVLVQRKQLSAADTDTAFWTAVLTGGILTTVTFLAAPLMALLFAEPQLTGIVRVLSVVFIFAALDSTQSALLDRSMRFRAQSTRRMIATLASALVAVLLAVEGAGVWALVAQMVTYEGATVVLLWSMADWRPRWSFSRASFDALFGSGARLMVIRMLRTLSTNADNFLIGITIGPVALGYYVIAYRVMVVINELLALALTPVILSMFSRLQDDLPALNSAFYRTSGLVTALGFPVYAGLALVARPLITLVFGAKWGPSVPVMRVLTIAGLAQVQMVFTGQYMLALGRYSSELRWTTGLVAAELIGFGVTVQFGIVPVAASLGVVLAVAWPLRLLWLRGAGGISLKAYFSPYRSVLAATIAMAAAVFLVGRLLIHSGRLPLLVAEILVGIGVYLGVFVALARSTAAEVLTMVKRLRG